MPVLIFAYSANSRSHILGKYVQYSLASEFAPFRGLDEWALYHAAYSTMADSFILLTQ
jgi:hypothetical protein